MTYAFGEVVLVPFPFTDQSGLKKRPAVVVSSSGYNRRDLIIMAITSPMRQLPGFSEAAVADWQAAGLIKPSVLSRCSRPSTGTRRANDGDALGQ